MEAASSERPKAKLSHLFMNDACLDRCRGTGYTQYNPVFPGADHGIQWCALEVGPLPEREKPDAAELPINFKAVTETTCAGRTGIPATIRLPHLR